MAGTRSNKGENNTKGYDYQLYTLFHCINCLRVCEYDIGNGIEGFGALDDVVFNATLASGKKITTAIQVKHSKKMIDDKYLCQDSRTFLYKYCKSFVEIRKSTPLEQLEQLILWTNMSIAANIRDWFEPFVPDSEASDILGAGSIERLNYERYRIKKDHRQNVAQKCTEKAGNDNGPSEAEWEQFFDRFVLYVNVPKVDGLKAHLVRLVGNCFDELCKLVEKSVVKQKAHSDQINGLFTLVGLRSCMETGPYTALDFSDLHKLKIEVKKTLDSDTINVLRIKASQDVDCTVARLIALVENILAAESKRYLVFSYKTFNDRWNDLKQLVNDGKIIEIGLQCLIISHITDDQIGMVENELSALKVIFVGKAIKSNINDEFDIHYLEDSCKKTIENRKIQFSQWQSATANEIFGEELFRKENYLMALELYRFPKDKELQITVSEPLPDCHYRSRIAKWNGSETKVDLLNQTEFRKVVINDLPGMGKTTEMVQLCSSFRKRYQDHLIVYVQCTTAVSKWKGSIKDLICDSVTSNNSNVIIEKVIQLGKVIIIMDGYDEVSYAYKEKLETLVSKLSGVGIFRLYIATRPQGKDALKIIIKDCGFCHLERFSQANQLAYLKKFWNVENVEDASKKATAESNTRRIMNQLVNGYGSSLIGIPLQTHMIADMYKGDIFSPNFKISESHNLGFIYKQFVKFKFNESVNPNYNPVSATHAQNKEDLWKAFLREHVKAALKWYEHESQSELELHCKKIEHYGIVLTSPTVRFVHFTYLEYFLALYILTYSTEYTIEWCVVDPHSLIIRFMDYLLDHINPTANLHHSLHEMVNTYERSTNYIVPHTARLHSEKMLEFHRALSKWCPKVVKSVLSTLIHNRMYNVFEVVYDSLGVEIKSQVRLCFDSSCVGHPKNMYFCLKVFDSVDTIIPIMNILQKKFVNIFVAMYLSPLGDQEKILELMCDPNYMNLFEWFTNVVPRLDKLQRAVVKLFVEIWLNRCLGTIISSGNIELLEKATRWIKSAWTAEAVRLFLTDHNLLCQFTEHIEHSICDSVEKVRADMVHSLFNLYRWAFDGQIPCVEEVQILVQRIQTSSIIEAFVDTFLSNR